MARYLIVNADDYCRTKEVSRGIRDAHLRGIVSSTTCMMNMADAENETKKAFMETPNLGLGVHLTLTAGKPVLEPACVPSLVGKQGDFLNLEDLIQKLDILSPSDVMAEWRAQILKFKDISGKNPSHLDSHQHTSYFTPVLFDVLLKLAHEFNCAIRNLIPPAVDLSKVGIPVGRSEIMQETVPVMLAGRNVVMADSFNSSFYGSGVGKDSLMRQIRDLPQGITELMCHPGYVDKELMQTSSYSHKRAEEMAILTDPEVKNRLREENINLISYKDILNQ